MKILIHILAALFLLVNTQTYAQSYIEGPDLPGTGTGPAFAIQGAGPSISVQGTLNTPNDGQDRFQIFVPPGCSITGVTYLMTDTFNISVNGFIQFGTNNQIAIPPLTGSFTGGPGGPFPVLGPVTLDCIMSANIAANDHWFIVFFSNCGGCTDPDVPLLGPDQVICKGDFVNLAVGNANLNDAITWEWYADSCGLTSIGSGSSITVSPNASTSYFVRGEGGCVTPGACGSISIIVNVVDTSVSQSGNILTANSSSSNYQWLDCTNNNMPINGETAQSFTSLVSGSYSVQIVNANGCIDTSDCYTLTISAIENSEEAAGIFISPNPVVDWFEISFNTQYGSVSVELTDIQGKRLWLEKDITVNRNKKLTYNIEYLEKGLYTLKVWNDKVHFSNKLIKE